MPYNYISPWLKALFYSAAADGGNGIKVKWKQVNYENRVWCISAN